MYVDKKAKRRLRRPWSRVTPAVSCPVWVPESQSQSPAEAASTHNGLACFLPPYTFLRQSLSVKLELPEAARLAGHEASGPLLSLTLSPGVTGVCH